MTRPQSTPQRLEIPDGKPVKPGPAPCAGAVVLITRENYQSMARESVDWASPITEIPIDGRGQARVACPNEAMGERGVTGQVVYHALCAGCHGIETRNRQMLRQSAGEKAR